MASVRVKICGVLTPADARAAADAGADALGLNFYPRSPRFLTPEAADVIVRTLSPFVAPVGLFVGSPDAEVAAAAARFGLRAVQTYPDGPAAGRFFPAAHVPAFRVKDADSLAFVRQYVAAAAAAGAPVAAVLLDAHVDGRMGGTGHVAPWGLIAGFDPGVPVILAGGLTPANVGDAVRAVRPWGVDVASGVETAPGRKDAGKVRDFVRAARAAAARLPAGPAVSG